MLAAGAQVVLIDRDEEKVVGLCDKLGPKAPPLVVDLLDGPAVS
ncbi:MAG TPA: glucose dehydrogenase, partial [Rhodobacteraceae bacterium]|nr:glucose dehydrogenase [Paracoccaceae bacterium]